MTLDAVVLSAVRTPIGRYGGSLAGMRPDDLAALAIREAVARSGVEPARVEDVVLGCANQAGEDNRNVARMAGLLAGLPLEAGGVTVNRLCGSGMQAVVDAALALTAGAGDVQVAGGVESMTRAPLVMAKPDAPYPRGEQTLFDTTLGWRFTNPKLAALHHPYAMGETAENVAEAHRVSRDDQDAFALESQRKAGAAIAAGWFQGEIVPVPLPAGGLDGSKSGADRSFAVDEHPRPDVTPEQLAKLRPAFREGGTVTAGNASGLNDGACALVLSTSEAASRLGHKPLARIVGYAVAGVDPAHMGIGPVPASRKALSRAGLSVTDLDLVELNEAFASQSLACIRELGLDPARVNVQGGAIALGHPLGMSGARILTTLIHALRRTGGRYGLATMCIGVGQGIATIVENLDR